MLLDQQTLERLRLLRDEVRLGEGGSREYSLAGGRCGIVAEEIAVRFRWREFYGLYRLPDGRLEEHAWNDLPDGTILDATADQFEEGHDIRVVPSGHPEYRRYLRG